MRAAGVTFVPPPLPYNPYVVPPQRVSDFSLPNFSFSSLSAKASSSSSWRGIVFVGAAAATMGVERLTTTMTLAEEEDIGGAADGGAVSVVKAPSDQRLYQYLKLKNGMSALLIHDPAMASAPKDSSGQKMGVDEEDDEEEDEDHSSGSVSVSGSGEEEDEDEEDDMECDPAHPHIHHNGCNHGDGEVKLSSGFDETPKHSQKLKMNSPGPFEGDVDHESELEEGEEESDNDDDDDEMPSHVGAAQAPTKKAAAAMCVGVGSFSDPPDAQGLAHFLEHMLFMGSSKFPDENEYDTYLSKHGGGSNAFTETEFTCYHFDISPSFLKPALDRFSQFFISPLAKAEAMDREVQAIDSEFEQVLQSDACRLLQLQCHTAKPSHPFNKFSWGNRQSLSEPMDRGVDMRGKLLQLYRDHYWAGRMKLTILGGEPLDTLKQWAIELFGKVSEGGEARLPFTWDDPVWESGRMYRVESVRDQHLLAMTWPLPCLQADYLTKPQDYISHLVGHEGAGSLLSLLKAKGLATDLTAGVGDGGYDRSSAGYMFTVNINLTDSGLEHVLDVVGLLYQYVKMLRLIGPQEWVFKELQSMAMMEFRFAEEESADNYVVRLASNMHLYSEENIIYGDYSFEQWDPELVADLLKRINPSNMRLDIVTKSFNRNAPGVEVEPWFQVPYTIEILPADLLQQWENPSHVDPALTIPVVNAFIPHDFTIRTAKSVVSEDLNIPRVVLDDPALKVWYKLDQTFKTPRANTYFSVMCRAAGESIKAVVLTDIYMKLLEHELNETIYLANVAKLESSLAVTGDKIDLKLFGFNEKLPVLAQKIAELLTSLVPREDRFQVIKEDIERAYRNANMRPLKHSAYLRLQALKERFWHADDKLACLLSLTVKDVTDFIPQLFNQTYIEALCHGNLDEEEALKIANIFKQTLVKNVLPPDLRPQERIVKLPLGSSLLHSANVKNESEENSVVEMYFQGEQDLGRDSIRTRGIIDLFEQMIHEPCFNQLRTKEQLGYRVDCGVRVTYRVLGFCFRVQSAKYTPPFLEHRINTFIASFSQVLKEMTDEEFTSYKTALVEQKLERDHSLLDETDRHWEQIWDQRYLFDARKLEASELLTISKSEVSEWFSRFLDSSSAVRRKLSIHIWGCNAQSERNNRKDSESTEDGEVTVINDLQAFKRGKELFPVV